MEVSGYTIPGNKTTASSNTCTADKLADVSTILDIIL
jgi:hypothetical protein